MSPKTFTIFCSIISFALSLLASQIMSIVQNNRKLKEEKYNNFYKKFYILWNKIHKGQAFDFYDLKHSEREKIVNFLIDNYNYLPKEIEMYTYELKTNRLDNFNNNDIESINTCNKCYKKIIEFMIDKEQKSRKKFTNTKL